MGRYLTLWEHDMTRIPDDLEGQLELYTKFFGMLKEDMKKWHNQRLWNILRR